MAKALWQQKPAEARRAAHGVDWSRRMSDHIAFGLLVYTGMNIFWTMGALKGHNGTIMPYFGLVLLVAAIIPGCRMFEQRWERLSASGADDSELARLFRRDRFLIWAAALGLPIVVTAIVKAVLSVI